MPDYGALAVFVLVMMALNLVGMLVTLPLSPLTNDLLYVDCRIRNERLDIAFGEAAGLWTTQPQPAGPAEPAATERSLADPTEQSGEEPAGQPPAEPGAESPAVPASGEADGGLDEGTAPKG